MFSIGGFTFRPIDPIVDSVKKYGERKGMLRVKKAVVIGIAGGSASGKTTFAGNLKKSLQGIEVLELSMDSYFKPEAERPVAEATIAGKMYRDDNHPDSFDLRKLKQDLSQAIRDGRFQVVILEGLLTLWDKEIYEQLDLRLFVDCKEDERIVRRLRRNMNWGLPFEEIAEFYLDIVRYRHNEYVEPTKWRADFILNGSNPSEKALQMIAQYVKSLI